MKIVHYNTHSDGGSAVLMLRLHSALRELGHESCVRYRKGILPDAERREFCRSWLDRQRERLHRRFETWAMRADAQSFYGGYWAPHQTPPTVDDNATDIVHLHWVSQWLDLPSFLTVIPSYVPIVWTIHDMSPLAGGCFTYFGCDEMEKRCEICPIFRAPFNRWFAASEWKRRAHSLAGRKIFVVGNSAFTTGLIRKSALFRNVNNITTILPSLKLGEFFRHDKHEARRQLGIAPDRFVLGFGAAALADVNKGINRFWEVADKVGRKLGAVDALVFGDGFLADKGISVNVRSLGRMKSRAQQSLVYSAMDVFIITSRMETFGQVATEAQACGTPVWAFDVGGLRDAVQAGMTGNLVPFGDTERMAEDICMQALAGNLPVMGDRAATWVSTNFSAEKMAAQYIELYRTATNGK